MYEVDLACDGLSFAVRSVFLLFLRWLADDLLLRQDRRGVLPLEVGDLRKLMLQSHDFLLVI